MLAILFLLMLPLQTRPAPIPSEGNPGSELFSVVSPMPGDRFGTAVAAAGDVDRDGVPDVLVGAPRADSSGPAAGRAALFSGRDGSVLLALRGDSAFDAFGWALDGLGDLNADGVPELAIAAPAGTPSPGSVAVVSGRDGTPLFTLVGEAPGDRFGHAVAGLGDVDGDGLPDLAVGAPLSDVGGSSSGRLYVFSGQGGELLFTRDGGPFDQLAHSVAAAGDVDGDGLADVLVGVPFSDSAAFNGGSLLLLSGADGSELGHLHGTGIGDLLGSRVANVGDVDGDGVLDQAASAPGMDAGAIDAGAVLVRSGASGGLLLDLAGGAEGELLGAVAGLGDVDGDGHDDLVLGAASASGSGSQAGRIRIVSGATGTDLLVVDGLRPFDWFGASLAGLGDLDGDGVPDLAVGAPGHDDVLTKHGSLRVFSGANDLRFRTTTRSPPR